MLPKPGEFQFGGHTTAVVERRVEVLSAAANSCIESKRESAAHRHSGKATSFWQRFKGKVKSFWQSFNGKTNAISSLAIATTLDKNGHQHTCNLKVIVTTNEK